MSESQPAQGSGDGTFLFQGISASDDVRQHNGHVYGDVINNNSSLQRERSFFNTLNQEERNWRLVDAAKAGQFRRLTLLLNADADPDSADQDGVTALCEAVKNRHRDCAAILLTHGADINLRTNQGYIPVSLAVLNNDLPFVQWLVQQKANLKKMPEINSALGWAYCHNPQNVDMIRFLIDSGAQKEDALFFAASRNNVAIVTQLLDEGVSIDATSHRGSTALHFAADRNGIATVEFLLSRNATIDKANASGWSALSYAACLGYSSIVKTLVAAGSAVDFTTTKEGWTPLMLAAEGGHESIVRTLLQYGAKADLKDVKGRTAKDMARIKRRTAIVRLL